MNHVNIITFPLGWEPASVTEVVAWGVWNCIFSSSPGKPGEQVTRVICKGAQQLTTPSISLSGAARVWWRNQPIFCHLSPSKILREWCRLSRKMTCDNTKWLAYCEQGLTFRFEAQETLARDHRSTCTLVYFACVFSSGRQSLLHLTLVLLNSVCPMRFTATMLPSVTHPREHRTRALSVFFSTVVCTKNNA